MRYFIFPLFIGYGTVGLVTFIAHCFRYPEQVIPDLTFRHPFLPQRTFWMPIVVWSHLLTLPITLLVGYIIYAP